MFPPHKRSLVFLCILSAFIISAKSGAAQETWTLQFQSRLSLAQTGAEGTVQQTTTANGQAQLSIDDNDVLTGMGRMNVSTIITVPGTVTSIKGSGPVEITGRREGHFLYFQIKGDDIPMKGTIKVAGMTMSHNSSFSPSILAPVDVKIERKTGATTSQNHDAGGMTATHTFTLTGGSNVKQESPPPPGTFPAEKNIWVLELDSSWTTQTPHMGLVKSTMTGSAEFPLPLGDGPAVGQGPLILKSGGVDAKGTLILRGEIKDNVLHFQPKASFESGTFQTSAGTAQSGFGAGIRAFDESTEMVKIPVEDGAEIKNNFSHAASRSSGSSIFRLHGKKIEKWLVTIDDFNTDYIIDSGTPILPKRAGMRVHVRREITVEIENNRFKQGKGTSRFISTEPVAVPDWAYKVKQVPMTIHSSGLDTETEKGKKTNQTPYIFPASFTIQGQKSGSRLQMILPDPCGYVVGIDVTVDHQAIRDQGYTINKYALKKRTDTERRELYNRYTVTLTDGWTHSNAPKDAESRTTLTVKRLKQ